MDWTALNPDGTRSFQQVLAAVPNGYVLTLPAGTYTIGSDFPASNGYTCCPVPSNVAGIWGSGASTVLEMAPNSSTAAGTIPTTTGSSNLCVLLGIGHSNFKLKNLKVLGTPQGHYYGGVQFYPDAGSGHYMSGIVVDGVTFINAAPGNANFPPGETFQLELNWCSSPQVLNCEMDGTDPSTGTPTSASPLGFNNCTNSYVQDTNCHDGIASMPTWYRCSGIHTLRLRSYRTGSGNGQYSGSGINHEQCDGTVLHESPTLQPGYGVAGTHGTRNALHLAWENDDGSHTAATTLTVTDAVTDNGPSGNTCLSINSVTTLPSTTVTKSGVTLTPLAGGATGNPAANYIVYT